MRLIHFVMSSAMAVGMIGMSGCGVESESVVVPAPAASTVEHDHDGDGHPDHGDDAHADGGHNHGGFWCTEHGVPEEECALCDTSLVSGFKEKGDWCEEHNRPDSQCFKCNPENFAKFAARYEAKFGEQPPEPTE